MITNKLLKVLFVNAKFHSRFILRYSKDLNPYKALIICEAELSSS